MHSHAHQAVPVTFFLGDSAQLESHTSESPESKQQQERRESEEKREPLGRQEIHRPSGCLVAGRALSRAAWAEGGGGEGRGREGRGGEASDFLALEVLLGVGLSDYRGAGTLLARTGIMRCLQNAGILWSTENPTRSGPGTGPVGYRCPGEGSLDLPLWPRGWLALILTRPAHSAAWAWNLKRQVGEPKASLQPLHHWASMSCPALTPALSIEADRQALAKWKEASF